MFREDAIPISNSIASPELFSDSTGSSHSNNENNLDDIWGSTPSSPTSETYPHGAGHMRNEPSDIPRLRSVHSTAGYRDGMSNAKNTTIQEGFDEGYSLGAVIGLEVGILVGKLEGIYNAIRNSESNNISDKRRMSTLLETVRRELRMEDIFGREWWSEDGTWKFKIPGEGNDGVGNFTFKDVVNSHPLIQKWKSVVDGEVERWGLDMGVMDKSDGKRLDSDDER